MNAKVKAKALETLDRMEQIVRADRLIQGEYVSDDVDERLSKQGAVCGGHKACLIGSLFLAYDERIATRYLRDDSGFDPFFDQREFVENRKPLRVCYEALDSAGQAALRRRGIHNWNSDNAAESLFESHLEGPLKRPVLRLIASARKQIETAA